MLQASGVPDLLNGLSDFDWDARAEDQPQNDDTRRERLPPVATLSGQ
jgi:hypothetical protein